MKNLTLTVLTALVLLFTSCENPSADYKHTSDFATLTPNVFVRGGSLGDSRIFIFVKLKIHFPTYKSTISNST